MKKKIRLFIIGLLLIGSGSLYMANSQDTLGTLEPIDGVHCTCGVNSGNCVANGDGESTCKNSGSRCWKRNANCD